MFILNIPNMHRLKLDFSLLPWLPKQPKNCKSLFHFMLLWCRKVKNIEGASSKRWGKSALPGSNRVNWSAKYWGGGQWPPPLGSGITEIGANTKRYSTEIYFDIFLIISKPYLPGPLGNSGKSWASWLTKMKHGLENCVTLFFSLSHRCTSISLPIINPDGIFSFFGVSEQF